MTETSTSAAGDLERRVLLCAPTGRDARLIGHILHEAGIAYAAFARAHDLIDEIPKGAGAVVVAEEGLTDADQLLLASRMSAQPQWSDLALVLLTIKGGDTPAVGSAIRGLGNVTLLERPLRAWGLLSVIRAALRARGRQYQMRDQLGELERLVSKLQEAEAILRDADRRKDEFLASLAHELRNPLAPIRNSVELMRMSKSEDRIVKRAGEVIDRQSRQLSRLVDDLLDLSRITRGKVSLQRIDIPLAEVLRNAVETAEPALRAADLALEYEPPSYDIFVDVDPVRIAQAVSNVLNNAAKFTPHGGRVTLTARCDDGTAEVCVRDTGIGIAPEMLEGIFDLFVQEERRDGVSRAGLGIGLTLVKRFIEMHGGSVVARSDGPGKGTEIVMRLPCVIAPGKAHPSESVEVADPATRPVLVVDDNRDNAATMRDLLAGMGFDVRVAYDGREALGCIESSVPDVVLMDIGMPGMDGFEVARRIRRHPGGDSCVIIAMTGWSQDEQRARARSAGFDHHLVKPVDFDRLKVLLGSQPVIARGAMQASAD